jgi:hypothetical protein
MRSSLRFALASIAASSVVMLGSARASAYDHMNAALDFVYNAVVNDADISSGCYINWSTWEGHTRGACFFISTFTFANGYTGEDVDALWDLGSGPTSGELYGVIAGSPLISDPTPPATETYFRNVNRITLVQSGDVMVIGTGTDGYSGHTMLARGAAFTITAANPKYTGTQQWLVPIIDSTASHHGCSGTYKDSRWVGPCPTGGYMDDGAGFAYIRIYTSILTQNIIGYAWGASGGPYYALGTRPFAFGRLVNLPPPITDPPPPT